jgi:hypothetical protein
MKKRLVCHDKIRKLLAALLEEPDPKRIADIVEQESFPPRVPLSYALGESLSRTYYAALNDVMKELVPHHAPQLDLAQALWKLFGEVAANTTRYCIRGRLTKRLDEFAEEWKKPLKLYEVVYLIDNLHLGTEVFTFGHMRFFTMSDAELIRWGFSKDNPLDSSVFKRFTNHAVAVIKVWSSDNSRAFETGLQQVLAGLDLLRLAGVSGRLPRLDDEMFLWKLDGAWLARQIEDVNQHATQGWYRTFRPLIIDMGPHIREGLESEHRSLQAIADGELPEEITSHLKRAINWISNSVTRERPDDKVVDLCTALETMLLPSYEEGWKGQMVDLRHRLIGGSWEPGGIFKLYELRSRIVHGGALNVSQHLDYWHLILMCLEALKLIVNNAKRNPQVKKLKDLIETIETKEKLEDFITYFEKGTFKGKYARKVKEAAKKQLRKVKI